MSSLPATCDKTRSEPSSSTSIDQMNVAPTLNRVNDTPTRGPGAPDAAIARDLLRRGAFDYTPKPCALDYLERAVAAALPLRTGLHRSA